MESSRFIEDYIEKFKTIEEMFLCYYDAEGNDDILFERLTRYFSDQKIAENKIELKAVLHLISKISDNHHRPKHFYDKIKQILKYFQMEIKTFFTNHEIFNIFKSNKLILLILFEEKIIIPDKCIASIISKNKYKKRKYPYFFNSEFRDFFSGFEVDDSNFEQIRKTGECSENILQLVRDDSIDEFKKNYKNNTKTRYSSIFETNLFLIKNEPSLLEYAAFYGSSKIFQYLLENWDDYLSSNIWLFIIHGSKKELITILEKSDKKIPEANYYKCFKESIKCHNFDFIDYYMKKFNDDEKVRNINFLIQNLHFYNFINLSNEIKKRAIESNTLFAKKDIFKALCKYDYYPIVNFLSKKCKIESSQILFIFK